MHNGVDTTPEPFFRRIVYRQEHRDNGFSAHGAQQKFDLATGAGMRFDGMANVDGKLVLGGYAALTCRIHLHCLRTRRQVRNPGNESITGLTRAWVLRIQLGNVRPIHSDDGRKQLAANAHFNLGNPAFRHSPSLKLDPFRYRGRIRSRRIPMNQDMFLPTLPDLVLQSALQKREALVETKNHPSSPNHRFPDPALKNAVNVPPQFPDLPVLLHHPLAKHFPGGDFLAKRLFQQFYLLLENFELGWVFCRQPQSHFIAMRAKHGPCG